MSIQHVKNFDFIHNACACIVGRFKSGLKRSILIGWTNTLQKMIDSSSFSEYLLFPITLFTVRIPFTLVTINA